MERFKELEREMKTKAYSREGLQKGSQLSEEEKAEEDCKQWISEFIETIREQLEMAEADVEALSGSDKKKKKNASKIQTLSERIEIYKWHIERLELIIRGLENKVVDIEEVNNIKEDLDCFVESNQDPDFFHDDELYDALQLEDKMAQAIVHVASTSASASVGTKHSKASADDVESVEVTKKKKKKDKKDKDKDKDVDILLEQQKQRQAFLAQQSAEQQAKKEAQQQQMREEARLEELRLKEEQEKAKATRGVQEQQGHSQSQPQVADGQQAPQQGQHISQPQVSSQDLSQDQGANFDRSSQQARNASQFGQQASQQPPIPLQTAQTTQQQSNTNVLGQQQSNLANSSQPSQQSSQGQAQQQPPSLTVSSEQQLPAVQQRTPRSTLQLPVLDNRQRLSLLDSSLLHCPQPVDSDRPKVYYPKQPFRTPSSFPPNPPPQFESPAMFERFDVDLLFLIFFHQQGTYQQYLASRELKRQSWRFHKKYRTWFQRHEDPTESTDTYEKGTFVYFDYESGWCQRIKTDFQFDYQYLE
mmetsp:Transcript_13473/g.24940  ORF Transcript_13473/g.24940 Transcript_13473/m.24940 type:complete len:531 (+) Transcript_13473:545-2137(+)